MSEPRTRNKDRLQGAMSELVSAISALNMPATPKQPQNTEAEWLSQTDHWAAHAMEHINAAFMYLQKMEIAQRLQELQHFEKEANK